MPNYTPTFRLRRTVAILIAALALVVVTPVLAQPPGEIDLPGRPDVSNRDNPYDHIGALHNEGLDYVIGARKVVGDLPAPLATAIVGRAMEFVADQSHDPCGGLSLVDLDEVALIVADPSSIDKFIERELTEEQISYYRRIEALIPEMLEKDEAFEKMKALEKEIAADLGEQDAMPLLVAASIARNSSAYWGRQAALGEDSPWFSRMGGEGDPLEGPIVLADVAGGLAGLVIGGKKRRVLGAIIGTIIGSALEAIDQLV
jgi:hypothetical protein